MNRRKFLKDGTLGVGATALAGVATQDVDVSAQQISSWDRVADVVIAGAGASGLCAAIMARDGGASVLVIEQNHDIGGHAMVSGGRIPLGGGTRLQKKFGVTDSADQVYLDHTSLKNRGTAIQRSGSDPRVGGRKRRDVRLSARQRGQVRRGHADACERGHRSTPLPHAAVLGRPERNHQRQPRIGPRQSAGKERTREGRRDPASAQPDTHRARKPLVWTGPGRDGDVPEQAGQHPGPEGRDHRHRRIYEQRRVPPDVRPAADRGVPGGRRALEPAAGRGRNARHGDRCRAVGNVECGERARTHRDEDAPHRRPLWIREPEVEPEEPDVPAGGRFRPDATQLPGRHLCEPVGPAILE